VEIPQILPSSDLLQQIRGIEQGLQQRRRLGTLGWIGALVTAAAQATVLVNNSGWLKALRTANWKAILKDWPFLLLLLAPILLTLVFLWTKFWLKESKAPFRYTYSVGVFDSSHEGGPVEEKMKWLSQDLMELFSKRVRRLSRLDEPKAGAPAADQGNPGSIEDGGDQGHESHIHVTGYYVIRERPNRPQFWQIEVTPWVRIGPETNSATLAHPVRFNLPLRDVAGRKVDSDSPQPPPLTADDYRKVVERVFFSVATQIYDRIRIDVQRKIDLLPTDRFRAVAYFHEAEDYARSNTLDAYEAARQLYGEAIALYDPTWNPLAAAWWRRILQYLRRLVAEMLHHAQLYGARLWPRLGHIPLLVSRAEIGYANMLLYRRALAAISGQRLNSVFEARPVATRAMEQLRRLGENVPGQAETLFDAYVTLGLTWRYLHSRRRADLWLTEARNLRPARADTDARFLFALGMADSRILSKLPLFRRAVELDPEFEVARFHLALCSDRLWRTRPTFEENVARDFVLEYYEDVTALNPGNISAWTNVGYVAWLLDGANGSGAPDSGGSDRRRAGHWPTAQEAFESGLEYKDIKLDTFVADLEFGLGRVAAEEGRLDDAFAHFRRSTIEEIGQGNAYKDLRGYTGYFFDGIALPLLKRYARYRARVERHLRSPAALSLAPRVRDTVHAYVLGDFAEACWNYYLRSSDPKFLRAAYRTYKRASLLDPENVMHSLRLYFVTQKMEGLLENSFEDIRRLAAFGYEQLNRILEVEPKWLDGNLAIVLEDADRGYVQPNAAIWDSLLPHDWLWKLDSHSRQTLDWKALRSRRYERELRWERAFDDVHVRTLFTLAVVLDRALDAAPAGAGRPRRRRVKRSRQGPAAAELQPMTATPGQTALLFAHLQRHFYPDDFELLSYIRSDGPTERLRAMFARWLSDDLLTFRALLGNVRRIPANGADPARKARVRQLIADVWSSPTRSRLMYKSLPRFERAGTYLNRHCDVLRGEISAVCKRQAMRRVVEDWLANPPEPYWAVRLVFRPDREGGPLFSTDEQIKWLEFSLSHPGRSPGFQKWAGDKLRDLGEDKRARSAYRKAMEGVLDPWLRGEIEAALAAAVTSTGPIERGPMVELPSRADPTVVADGTLAQTPSKPMHRPPATR
jgi:hypothetical protein